MPDAMTSILEPLRHMPPAGYLTLVVGVSVVCQWVAWRVRIPSILLLLVVGFGIGQLADPEAIFGHDVLFDGIRLTVGVILFEGSMSLRIRDVRDLARPVWRLCSVTVLLAWAMIAVTAALLGYQPQTALLIGAILVVTGPTVIAPILRSLRPTKRIASLLRWEGIIVDPIGTVLALLVFQAIVAGEASTAFPAVLTALGKTVVVAFGIGVLLGALLELMIRARAVPDFLQGVTFLAAAITALIVSDAIQPESGLLTVTVLGIYLGNRPKLHLEHVAEFTEHLQILFVGALFIVLAGRVTPDQLVDVAPKALILLVVLVLVVRPVSVNLGLLGTRVGPKERTLMACMAPRGVVAAAVTSIFAIGLGQTAKELMARADRASGADRHATVERAHELTRLAHEASSMVPLVFIVIIGTVAIYGISVGTIAERLGLASASPQGVMFVGVNTWVVETAQLLRGLGIPVLIVARNHETLAGARRAGLETLTANILSEYAVKDMDLAGLGYFVACTPEDETNATAAREFSKIFGRAHTYQLHRDGRSVDTGDVRHDTAGHLSGRFAFLPALSRADLDRRMYGRNVVARVDLSKTCTLADLRDHCGEDLVLLFVQRSAGSIEVVGRGARLPQESGTVIVMAPKDCLEQFESVWAAVPGHGLPVHHS